MKLLITEFIAGGGLHNHPLPAGLKQEGQMMLEALITDCMKIEELEIVTTVDSRTRLNISQLDPITIVDSLSYAQQIQNLARDVDMAWVIAPESEDVLASIVDTLIRDGIPVIGSDVETIHIAGDKWKCAKVLDDAGLPVIPVLTPQELQTKTQEVVIKPRFGVGCEGVRLVENGNAALAELECREHWIAQPLISGESRSLSLLCCLGDARILSCNVQELSGFPEPRLQKCIVNAFPPNPELKTLSQQIASALPGLNGYVGVDFIHTEKENIIVEINPRLTTSYIGLGEILQQNPAGLCIDASVSKVLPDKIINSGKVVEVSLV